MRAAFLAILCSAVALPATAQLFAPPPVNFKPPAPEMPQDQPPQNLNRPMTSLHGIVRNAATGEGLPRALVRVEGDDETGALTDGDGRFEIEGVPIGPQAVVVTRPGFYTPPFTGNSEASAGNPGPPRNVLVAAGMADVVFTLAPTDSIRGRIDLSTGDPAEGIQLALVRRVVANGRTAWRESGFARTRSDGTYRFGGLSDGEYALYTMPSLDGGPFTLVASGKAGAAQHWGYAAVYYPDARDPSGAAVVPLANGAEAQANFTLTREPFYTVSVALPQSVPPHAQQQSSAEIMDDAGHVLPYPAEYDSNAHSFQAALPDGTYSIYVTADRNNEEVFNDGVPQVIAAGRHILAGEADFTVASRAIPNLRVALAPVAPSPVQVTVMRSGTAAVSPAVDRINIMASPASGAAGNAGRTAPGFIGGEMMGQYAEGTVEGPLQSSYMSPGQYWIHTFVSGRNLCVSSFTAGGASLGREPLTIGISGQTAPMELTLRDDCAKLALSLPENLIGTVAGEEKFYTVFVVPDLDFTWDIPPVTLRPSSGGAFKLDGLTPGNYHVYTLAGSADLEYHNPAALAALPDQGQAVTLSPGATTNLVLEAPAQ